MPIKKPEIPKETKRIKNKKIDAIKKNIADLQKELTKEQRVEKNMLRRFGKL